MKRTPTLLLFSLHSSKCSSINCHQLTRNTVRPSSQVVQFSTAQNAKGAGWNEEESKKKAKAELGETNFEEAVEVMSSQTARNFQSEKYINPEERRKKAEEEISREAAQMEGGKAKKAFTSEHPKPESSKKTADTSNKFSSIAEEPDDIPLSERFPDVKKLLERKKLQDMDALRTEAITKPFPRVVFSSDAFREGGIIGQLKALGRDVMGRVQLIDLGAYYRKASWQHREASADRPNARRKNRNAEGPWDRPS